jgi:hypothetical protein
LIGDFLVKKTFRTADIPDAFEQFVEILVTDCLPRFNAFVIKGKAFYQQFGKAGGSQLAERCTAVRTNTITYG